MIEIGANLKEVLVAFAWVVGIVGALWILWRD